MANEEVVIEQVKAKHPDGVRLYMVEVDALPEGVTVTGSTWSSVPGGVNIGVPIHGDSEVAALIADGVSGTDYDILVLIDLTNGEVIPKQFRLPVRVLS